MQFTNRERGWMPLVLLTGVIVAMSASHASAQRICDPFGNAGCIDLNTGSAGSSEGGSSSGGGSSGPSAMSVRYAAARREAEDAANAWETTADNYLARGDYARAIEVYDKALKTFYTSENKKHYDNKKAEARRQWLAGMFAGVDAANRAGRYDEIPSLLEAAQRVWYNKELQRFIDGWKKTLSDRKEAERQAVKVQNAANKQNAKNQDAAKPDLTPARVGKPGSNTNAGDQLMSAGATAGSATGDLTINFDVGGAAYVGSLPVSAGGTAAVGTPAPSVTELFSHIPDKDKDKFKSDPVIQQSMAYSAKLDGQKADAQAKIAVVQEQIKTGKGDPAVLKAQEAQLNNDLKRTETEQAKTKDQVKERLTSIHIDWNEEPAKTDDKKDDKGDQNAPNPNNGGQNPAGATHAH
jgi:tetratricopeptide (TPR) repeat protein